MKYISIDNTGKVTGIYARKQKSFETIAYEGEVEIGWRYDAESGKVNKPALQGGMTLSEYKNKRVQDVNALCYSKIVAGFNSSALGSSHRYDSAEIDQFNALANLTIARDNQINVKHKCTEISTGVTEFKEHTPAQILQVFTEGGAHVSALLQRKNVIENQIKAATDFTEVDAVDINSGW